VKSDANESGKESVLHCENIPGHLARVNDPRCIRRRIQLGSKADLPPGGLCEGVLGVLAPLPARWGTMRLMRTLCGGKNGTRQKWTDNSGIAYVSQWEENW
jgi:hypothetical protein